MPISAQIILCRTRAHGARPVCRHIFGKTVTGSPRAIDFDRGVELFQCPCAIAGGGERTSPKSQRIGFFEGQMILLIDCQCGLELPAGDVVVATSSLDDTFGARNVACAATPVFSGGHYLTASSNLLGSAIDPIHRGVGYSQKRTRTHFKKQQRSRIPAVECVIQVNFSAGVITKSNVETREVNALS